MSVFDLLKNEDPQTNAGKVLSLSIANILNSVLNVILQMLIARLFSKTEVAIYSQSQLVCTTAVSILQMGIPSGLYYFLVREKGRTRAILNEGIFCVALSGMLFCIFIICGGNKLLANTFSNNELRMTLLLSIPYVLFTLFENVVLTLLVFKNRIRFNAYYNIVKIGLVVGSLIVCSLIFGSGSILFIMRVIVSILFAIMSIYLIYKYLAPDDGSQISKTGIKSILRISVPLGFAAMAGTLSSKLDSWIVSSLLSPETFSIYNMGAYEIPFIGVITGSIMTVVTVDMNEAVKNKQYERAIDIFSGVARKTSFFLIPIMVFFFVAAEDFMCFMFTASYIDAVPIFQCYLLYIPVRLVTYGPIMIALGKSKELLKREIISLILNATMSVVMVRLLGGIGACLSTILVTYVYSLPANIIIISRECNVKWYRVLPFSHIFKCLLLSLPGALLAWVVNIPTILESLYLFKLILMFIVFFSVTIILFSLKFKVSIRDWLLLINIPRILS